MSALAAASCSLHPFGRSAAEAAAVRSRHVSWSGLCPRLAPSTGRWITLHPLLPLPQLRRARLVRRFVASAGPSSQPSSSAAAVSAAAAAEKTIVPDSEFSLAKVSFGVIGLALGVTLLSYGFGAYFTFLPGSEWSALMLTYGFPLAIIGMALKYAELKPVPCITYSDAEVLRERCGTPILKQVRSDVSRYRYGDEQHLDEALQRIFQYGQCVLELIKAHYAPRVADSNRLDDNHNLIQYGNGGGIPRRNAPRLQMIREEVTQDGKYSLVLVFEAKALSLSDFEKRQPKFTSFFGPGIIAEIGKGDKDMYEVRLVSQTTS